VHMQNFQKSGAEIVMGRGRFVGERTIEVTGHDGSTRVLRGERVFINTGTRATIDSIPGLAEAQPLTHVEALELETLPEHVMILGGGYVGLEFAQAMRRFGSQVTIIERSPRILSREDDDVAEAMAQLLADDGVEVVAGTDVRRVGGKSGSRVTVTVERGGNEQQIEGTHILVATGRTPNTEDMGFDAAGVALRPDGCLGNGRLHGRPSLHAHLVRRLPDNPRQSQRRQSRYDGAARAFVSVHGSRACSRRHDGARSRSGWKKIQNREGADESRVALANAF
jgi:pyruvate/2-oxoglutarate dehydrogenase complex dihydrolipoamide dehydrogenase (E3) component